MDEAQRAKAVRYRSIQLALALVLTVVVLLGVVYGTPEGRANTLPDAIERISPVDGAQVPRQYPVVIDLAATYEMQLSVRRADSGIWEPVPPRELTHVASTGVYTWTPQADGFFGDLGSGDHRLRVSYQSVGTSLDAGTYEWSFRTY
jgi:hypothetical protein